MWKPFTPRQKSFFYLWLAASFEFKVCPFFYDGIMNHWPWWSMLWYDDIAPVKFGLNPRREKKSLTKNHRGIAPWASWVHCLKLETIRMVYKKQAHTAWNYLSLSGAILWWFVILTLWFLVRIFSLSQDSNQTWREKYHYRFALTVKANHLWSHCKKNGHTLIFNNVEP